MPTVQILVVEDDFIVARSIQNKLKSLGYGVPIVVTTGEEAVQQVAEIRPDLVLMDIKLPGTMDGVATAKQIDSDFDIPVVYITAYADVETLERAKMTEPFGYIIKPFGIKELHSTVEIALYKHQMNQKLKENERRYRTLFDGVPVGLYRIRADGQILEANLAMVEMLGYPNRTVLLAVNAADLYVEPEDRQREQALLVREGIVRNFETQLCRHDGTIIRVEDNVHAVYDDAGQLLYSEGNLVDITEHKQTEEALRESEQRYKQLLESVTDYVYTVQVENGQPVATLHNPGCTAVTGYSPSEYAADHYLWYRMIHQTDREAAIEQAHKILSGEKVPSLEHRLIHKDGATRWVKHTAVARKDNQGRVVAYDGLISDITERKALEEVWRRYEFIVNTSRDFMALIDENYMYVAVNEAYCKAHNRTRSQIIGRTVADVWGEERYLTQIKTNLDKCFAGNEVHYQNQFEFATLGQRYFDVACYPYQDDEGTVTHVVVVSRDITKRKQAEEALRETEEQYRQAQKLEAVGRLAGGVAHDFNNLLTVIIGHSEFLLSLYYNPDDPRRAEVEQIKQAAERASMLTRQLLAFSRQQTLKPQILNLNQVILNLEKMLRRLIGEDVFLVTKLAPDLGQIKADPGQMEQVLMNLAVNARDAMPRGGRLILATANIALDQNRAFHPPPLTPGPYILLTVTDTGLGMDAETQAHIFEPFFTTKAVGKGTGLGLSTVYGIVQQSDGHIQVESIPGQGTTFKIYLPQVEPTVESTLPGPVSGTTLGGPETILIVEDEASVRSITSKILQRQGYRVLEADRAETALTVCQEHEGRIDLLIADVIMPGQSGPELAKRLVQLYPNLKVLFVSGYTDEMLDEHGVLAPGIILLEKPFSPETLSHKVREVLDMPRQE